MRINPDRLTGPGGVTVAHIIIVSICVWYDPETLALSSLRGWTTFTLLAFALYSLFRCALVDPGIVNSKGGDLETPPDSRLNQNEIELPDLVGTVTLPDDEIPRTPSQPVLRWCAVCDLRQPLRTKHCQEINKCVRTFDHYCPWISNCVGEFNRAWFFTYLVAQSFVLIWFSAFGIARIHLHAGQPDKLYSFTALILAISLMCMFLLMTSLLVSYHAYLAATNMTTWEHSAWKKISYLKELNKVHGSPFSATTIGENVRMYFQIQGSVQLDQDGCVIWRMGPQHAVLPEVCQFFCDT